MKSCKHEIAGRIPWPTQTRHWLDSIDVAGRPIRTCSVCGARLALGPSDEHASERVEIEIRLAELLAETECYWEPCGAKDEQFDLYVDIFATDEPPPQLRRPGPRSPIEMMVDAACGYEHAQDEER